MFYYKLVIAYDGSDYFGWQWQPRQKSIAGQLEKSFLHAFKQKPLSLVGVSRTDAGVHSWGQVARLKISFHIEPEVLKRAWQGSLPPSILLRDVKQVDENFQLHSNIISKTYDYYVSRTRVMPFFARYCLAYFGKFDHDLLQKNLDVFLGTHDFRSFCTGDDKENTVRTINLISVFYIKRYNVYRIRVQGPGFLRYMIRRIVGASLQTMTLQLDQRLDNAAKHLKNVLAQKNPQQNLVTAPAQGLMLRAITYRR